MNKKQLTKHNKESQFKTKQPNLQEITMYREREREYYTTGVKTNKFQPFPQFFSLVGEGGGRRSVVEA